MLCNLLSQCSIGGSHRIRRTAHPMHSVWIRILHALLRGSTDVQLDHHRNRHNLQKRQHNQHEQHIHLFY